ncbi:ribokinase [Actinotalea sp. M2MS4P-6]|uniref:ribokinase n=1 Tax=Actinotalea sp. M2MS4P-6 TaxID=2983762 RepID=UPI0021E3A0CF|nr:ribokinase [Actinotalea sp. M2MS4P-6]MCV2394213.1 ribokinase [Actinotalea sp. M2MS4P-6]
MDHDVVVVGSVNADLVLEVPRHLHPGETLLGRDASVLPGGKGANQAVAAARLGADVAMVGAVGTDPNADVALAELRRAGVDLAAVRRVEGPTGLAVVTLADDGENSIIVIPGANSTTDVAAVEAAASTIAGAAVCVLQAEIPLDAVGRAAHLAHEAGRRVVLNVAPACRLPLDVLRLADPLVVNEHEAAILLGADPGTAVPAEQTVRELAELGVGSVVLTLGAAGVVGLDATGTWSLPARPVTPRDTTGAGDAFVGALAVGLAQGDPARDAALLATRVAAASVQRLGAQLSYPWKDDPLP